jgi:uncharacterized RDD family membrane protein YckC
MDLPPPPPPQLPPREGGLPYPPSPPVDKSELPPSGPGSPGIILPRAAAWLIDQVIATAPLQIIRVAAWTETENGKTVDNTPTWVIVLAILAPIVYTALMLSWRGQTVGKMLLHLKVVTYADGGPITRQEAWIRATVPMIPTLLAFAVPVPAISGLLVICTYLIYLSAAIDPVYRGLHEKASGTIELRTR